MQTATCQLMKCGRCEHVRVHAHASSCQIFLLPLWRLITGEYYQLINNTFKSNQIEQMSMSRKLLIREQMCIYKYNTGRNNQLFIKWMLGKWASSRVRCCHNWSGTTGVLAAVCVYVCMFAYVFPCAHTHTDTHKDLSPRAKLPPNTTRAARVGSLLPNELSD